MRKLLVILVLLSGATAVGWLVVQRLREDGASLKASSGPPAAPVEVGPVERGAITLRRTFSGTLEAAAEFAIAPKVGGRLKRLTCDLGDPVLRGQVVAWLDDDEFLQALAQAQADLAVARANVAEAKSALEIAKRTLARMETLRERGVVSETEYDSATAEKLAQTARLEVAEAQITRAEAQVETARIRLGYTKVAADWSGGDDQRIVAERYVDEGDTVGANTRLLAIVELDPLRAVVFVPERDYGRLGVGQVAALETDAFPDVQFQAAIERIAPVFRRSSRQARVELTVPNADGGLKPGMFLRATVVLDQVEDATIVPFAALTDRGDETGVFAVDRSGTSVRWCPVSVGVREGDRVQVMAKGLAGRVVTLGQQLCDDGSPITIPDQGRAPPQAPLE